MNDPLLFFILGNHPAISIAEIVKKLSLKDEDVVAFSGEFLIIKNNDHIIVSKLQNQLGGTIKIGEIIENSDAEKILLGAQKNVIGKFQFGLSFYGKEIQPPEIWKMGAKLKNTLREHGSVRFVRSQDGQNLSSVIVEKNGLVNGKGVELCFLSSKNKTFIGKTLSVQDFESLGKRDFGRPSRDDYSGMIPPKLAQVLINLADGEIIWDPFCGSGTILQEALLMGYKKIVGSDNSKKAVDATQQNLEWLKKEFGFEGEYEIFEVSAQTLTKKLSVLRGWQNGVIVTEPYLGAPKNRNISDEMRKIETLYRNSLLNWHTNFPNLKTIVMIWPVFVERRQNFYLSPSILQKNWIPQSVLPQRIKSYFQKELSLRGNLLYGRPGQGVMREIMVLHRSNNDF